MSKSNDLNPLVSVLMTIYNREAFLAEAIESVLQSTYSNWELILCDDRSTDASFKIAESFASKDNRIKVFQNTTNLGDYPNRNMAASHASGKYFKYVDADDKLYPYGLEQLVYYMEQFPEAAYGLCSLEQDDERMYPFQLSPKKAYEYHYIKKREIFHKAPLSSIIKKSVFDEVKGFANVRHFGDFELWHRLSKYNSVVLMPHGIVWYRKSEGQEAAIRKKNPVNALKTFQAAKNHINSEDCPITDQDKKKILSQYDKLIASLIIYTMRHGQFAKAIELKELSKLNYSQIVRDRFFKN